MGTADEELLSRIRAGDSDAWADAFKEYHRLTRRVVTAAMGGAARSVFGRSADDVETIVWQEAMRNGVPDGVSLRAHLLQLCRSRAIDALRRGRAHPEEELPSSDEEDTEKVRPGDIEIYNGGSVEEEVAQGDLAERISAHLGVLTDGQRYAVVERVMKQRPAKDVAAELNVSPPRVAQLVTQAYKRLRPALDADEAITGEERP